MHRLWHDRFTGSILFVITHRAHKLHISRIVSVPLTRASRVLVQPRVTRLVPTKRIIAAGPSWCVS